MKKGTLNIKTLLEKFDFEILNIQESSYEKQIETAEFNRPGLELVGYFDYTDFKRPIILGLKEIRFIETLKKEDQERCFDFLTRERIPYILIARGLQCPSLLLDVCIKKNFPLFRSKTETSVLINEIMQFVNEKTALQELCHGTLLEIFGMGVLLVGKSGIGKSESALELIKKGHRLISDDSIITYKIYNKIYGKSPKHLKNLLEVRGIGVIDVSKIFGITSVIDFKTIDYVVELVSLEEINAFERLTLDEPVKSILDVDIPLIRIPVTGGRFISDLIEVGITNLKLKSQGFNATKELMSNFDKLAGSEESNDD